MADQPRYHGGDENSGAGSAPEPRSARQRRNRVLVIAIVIALFLTFAVLHLTGTVGAGMHG